MTAIQLIACVGMIAGLFMVLGIELFPEQRTRKKGKTLNGRSDV